MGTHSRGGVRPKTIASHVDSTPRRVEDPRIALERFEGGISLEWMKAQGKGYQSRINAILRAYYEAHRNDAR